MSRVHIFMFEFLYYTARLVKFPCSVMLVSALFISLTVQL